MSPTRNLIAAAALVAAAGAAHAQIHVTQTGSFDPNGAATAPFRTLHSAACASVHNPGPIRFEQGEYGGLGTFIAPATLETMGGPVVLGDQGSASTTLSVASFNTHLFGDVVPGWIEDMLVDFGVIPPLTWQENARAARIGDAMAASDIDIFALQEVWDPDLWTTIWQRSGYPDGSYGLSVDNDDLPCIQVFGMPVCVEFPLLNLGVGTFTRPDIVEARQIFYAHETGDHDPTEPFASKGWVFTEIVKDGFKVAVYNTHMQAGPSSNPYVWGARLQQITQLANEVIAYRDSNPSVPVLIVGDLNVMGSGSPTSEYFLNLRSTFQWEWFTDAAREIYCFRSLNGNTTNNDVGLGPYFNPDDDGGVRLDYVLYSDSADGTVEMVLRYMETEPLRGPNALTEDGFTTDYLSDHFAVKAYFDLIRR